MRVVLLVILIALAGCGKPAGTEAPDPFEVQATPETGVIRGVVVDAAIQPLGGATATLVGTEYETTTRDDGSFGFEDLTPGAYTIRVTSPDFLSAETTTSVVAGVAKPEVVRFQLEFDFSNYGYVKDLVWDGFVECSTNWVAVCGALHDNLGLTDDTYRTMFDTDADITHLQTEIVWESTQDFGDSFFLLQRYATEAEHEAGLYAGSISSGEGPSPLLVIADVETYNENRVGEDYEFVVAVFSGGSTTNDFIGLTLSQEYQIFLHEFHGYKPPNGWRFSAGAGLPPP